MYLWNVYFHKEMSTQILSPSRRFFETWFFHRVCFWKQLYTKSICVKILQISWNVKSQLEFFEMKSSISNRRHSYLTTRQSKKLRKGEISFELPYKKPIGSENGLVYSMCEKQKRGFQFGKFNSLQHSKQKPKTPSLVKRVLGKRAF